MNKSIKKMVRIILPFLVIFLIFCAGITALAHSGKTDSSGGHTNRSTGSYHYHHGYPAHDHYDMDGDGKIDCPYNFVDNTDHKTTTSPNRSTNTGTDKKVSAPITKTETEGSVPKVTLAITFVVVFLILFVPRYFFNEDDQNTPIVAKIFSFISSILPQLIAFLIICMIKGNLRWAVLSTDDIFTAFLISAGLSFPITSVAYVIAFFFSMLFEKLLHSEKIIPSYSDSYAFTFALLMIYQLIQ